MSHDSMNAAKGLVYRLRDNVIKPLNLLMVDKHFTFPLPADLFGQRRMVLDDNGQIFNLISLVVFNGAILEYRFDLVIPASLQRQGLRQVYRSELVEDIEPLYPWIVDTLNNLPYFKVLRSYFGEEVLLTVEYLALPTVRTQYGKRHDLALQYSVFKKVLYPLSSPLFNGGF